MGRKNEVKEDLLELFACHLFNVNKEQVLPSNPQPLIPSLPDFYKQTGDGKGSAGLGVWGTRVAVEAQWVTKVEERGTAAFGELELYSVFGRIGGWLKCLEPLKEGELGLRVKSSHCSGLLKCKNAASFYSAGVTAFGQYVTGKEF